MKGSDRMCQNTVVQDNVYEWYVSVTYMVWTAGV